ncbi:MAG: hypothetical protein JOZ14_05035 [Acidobacteria bacterium]|nr:hypothetical protein [Acidobacteriota bacterium]
MPELGHENHGIGFEREDLGSRPIYGFMLSLVVVGVLIYYILWGMFHFLDAYNRTRQTPASPLVVSEAETRTVTPSQIREFPEPRLEDNERTELNDFRYREEETLNSYGWVDQNARVAHIPIARAMQLVAERGLPTTPRAGKVPLSPVNLAQAAAAASDTSTAPAPSKQPAKGKNK